MKKAFFFNTKPKEKLLVEPFESRINKLDFYI